jgi:ABC-2 type transport system permease protein
MRNQIASEFRKLTSTRSAFAMLLGLLAFTAFGVVGTITGQNALDLAQPVANQAFLSVPLLIVPLFALLLGIRSFTDEFRNGSIVPTLLASPHRARVLAAKLVTVATGGAVFVVASTALALAIGVPMLMAEGAVVSWSASAMAEVVGRLLLTTILWTGIGVGVGLAVRHQVAAIAGALIWMIVGEGFLSGLVPDIAKYFPGAAGYAVAGIDGIGLLAPGIAAAVLAGYALVATVTGGALMQRRDIT